MNKGNCSLVLKNVNVNDEDVYKCYHVESISYSFKLRVIQKVHLSVDGSFPEDQINITARVGSTARLPCKCNTEYLIPHAKWKTDNETVFERLGGILYPGEGYEGRVDVPEYELNKGNCSLVLKNVRVTDENVYKCYHVESISYSFKLRVIQTVHLSVDGSFSEDQINITARVGSTARLPCKCNTEYPISHVEWKIDTETVFERWGGISYHGEGYEGRVDVPEYKLNKGDCSLVLKNVNVNDEDVYKCYHVESISYSFKLRVIQTVHLSVDGSFSEDQINITARVSSTALLPCKCNTEYPISHVEWAIDFETVFERLGDISYHGEGYEGRVDVPEDELNKGNCSLVLKDVRINDESIYRCYHPERFFGSLIQTVHLSVDAKETQRSDSDSFRGSFPEDQINITARVGSTARLPCKCNTDYPISHAKWKTDNETVFERLGDISYHGEGYEGRVDVPEDELNKGNCSLVLKDVRINDESIYRCYHLERFFGSLIQTVHLSVDAKETQSSDSDSFRGE
ncbi:uncharacterized protein LOC134329278 [Trichomycterus rosablanca]|uniref:uncharacterized protein LOC134329278 n=1 Tax=Trichomycterus rosablanca TaxID=2290929 RepID=UPI002F356C28